MAKVSYSITVPFELMQAAKEAVDTTSPSEVVTAALLELLVSYGYAVTAPNGKWKVVKI